VTSEPSGPGPLGEDAVAYVARLARLELTEEERRRFAAQLSAVLGHVEALRRLDLAGVPPAAHAFELANVVRPDEVRPGLARDEALAGAPAVEAGCFRVGRILAEEP